MVRLIIATQNEHKVSEFRDLLRGIPLGSLADFPPMPDVDEKYSDFARNAALKALSAHQHTGKVCLADDSGLEVEALGGQPGVRSKRFVPGTDQDRYEELLRRMSGKTERTARFVCALAVAGLPHFESLPSDLKWYDGCLVALGFVHGQIAYEAKGHNGFGYDPIFALSDGRTMGQLKPLEKQKISHRFDATRRIKKVLSTFFIDGSLPST